MTDDTRKPVEELEHNREGCDGWWVGWFTYCMSDDVEFRCDGCGARHRATEGDSTYRAALTENLEHLTVA